jgi:hypothetical protein
MSTQKPKHTENDQSTRRHEESTIERGKKRGHSPSSPKRYHRPSSISSRETSPILNSPTLNQDASNQRSKILKSRLLTDPEDDVNNYEFGQKRFPSQIQHLDNKL